MHFIAFCSGVAALIHIIEYSFLVIYSKQNPQFCKSLCHINAIKKNQGVAILQTFVFSSSRCVHYYSMKF